MLDHNILKQDFKNLQQLQKVHIIGIGGCASSAVAQFLTIQGIKVTGSDLFEKQEIQKLRSKGITVNVPHNAGNLKNPDLVLYSPAIVYADRKNPELQKAEELKIPAMSWEEFIGHYFQSKNMQGIIACGSEGKGSVCGILTCLLQGTDFDPMAILGADFKSQPAGDRHLPLLTQKEQTRNYYLGKSQTFILEGDEYNRNFHHYQARYAIFTNIEYEHPETYASYKEYKDAFFEFIKQMQKPGELIFRATKNNLQFVLEYELKNPITFYGNISELRLFTEYNELKYCHDYYLIDNVKVNPTGTGWDLYNLEKSENTLDTLSQTTQEQCLSLYKNQQPHTYFIPILPAYNAHNATAAIIMAIKLRLPNHIIKKNLGCFRGMVRRFDVHPTEKGGVVITDYGHSPRAVQTVLTETKKIWPQKKLHILFQPHMYSRTLEFLDEFAACMDQADVIILTDIYPSREHGTDKKNLVHTRDLYNKMQQREIIKNKKKSLIYLENKKNNILDYALEQFNSSEILILQGAGDMNQFFSRIITTLCS